MTQPLNPIQQKIAGGMSPIAAFLSESTCSEACWYAKDETCHCKCGGKNHGCMRGEGAERPQRTARIDGYHYRLVAIGEGVDEQAYKINLAHGEKFRFAAYSRESWLRHLWAKVRLATVSQCAKWPELASYRGSNDRPYLLWVREDVQLVSE